MPQKPPPPEIPPSNFAGDGPDQNPSNRSGETPFDPEGANLPDGPAGQGETHETATALDSPTREPIWKASRASRLGEAAERKYPDEMRARAKVEWVLGLKTVQKIADELGIARSLVYSWAQTEEWPARGSARKSLAGEIDATLIAQASADLRERARAPETAEDQAMAKRLAESGFDVDEQVPESGQQLREYAYVVTEVIRAHQQQATKAVEIGENILAMYGAAVARLRQVFETAPRGTREQILARLELIKGTTGQYATLIRALREAHRMQRDSFELVVKDAPGADPLAKGNAASSGSAPMPESYEDVLAELEKRGRVQ